MIHALAFYLFAFVAVAAGVLVIASRNPVHSVLFLILAFFNAAGLFVLMGAEFLAMILVVVYVGAVAVSVYVRGHDARHQLRRDAPGLLAISADGALIGLVMLVELLVMSAAGSSRQKPLGLAASPTPELVITNTHAIGQILYTKYIYLFQASGMVLSGRHDRRHCADHRRRPGVRKQVIADQIARDLRMRSSCATLRREGYLMIGNRLGHYLTVAAILFHAGHLRDLS